MMQRLHHDHPSMRLVRARIQSYQTLSVKGLPQQPLPPITTLLRQRQELLQIVRLRLV
jgi:hypothetical protein